jgi:hypothetical protein
MVVILNDKTYMVTDESIYSDFSIQADTIDDAVQIITDFENVDSYTFDMTEYTDMVVRRRIIIVDDAIAAKIQFRQRTSEEMLRSDLEDFASTASKTNAKKIEAILSKGGDVSG